MKQKNAIEEIVWAEMNKRAHQQTLEYAVQWVLKWLKKKIDQKE